MSYLEPLVPLPPGAPNRTPESAGVLGFGREVFMIGVEVCGVPALPLFGWGIASPYIGVRRETPADNCG